MDKLVAQLRSQPKNFTWNELTRAQKSGFRVQLHKPHPANILKQYALKEVLNQLMHEKLI